jgi:hypothetical protein
MSVSDALKKLLPDEIEAGIDAKGPHLNARWRKNQPARFTKAQRVRVPKRKLVIEEDKINRVIRLARKSGNYALATELKRMQD